jgi:hypothetical protein
VKIKSERDFWSGLMFISARPGPAYFPFGLGVLLAVLGGFILFKAMTFAVEGGDKIGAWAWRPLLMIVVSVLVFGLVLPRLGLILCLPLLVIMSAFAGDEFRWKEVLLNAAILTVGSYLIFIAGLKLTLPLWPTFLMK